MNVYRVYPSASRPTEMLFVAFNQDSGCFACGTDSGFRIYNVDPFKETFKRNFNNGIGIVEMLFRCNLLALVGGGNSPRYPPNKVMIWDDHQNRCVGELSFRSDVRAVKLRRDRVVVVLATKVYVYRFSDLKLLDQIDTQPNPRGLVALCPHPKHNVLACPGVTRGHARVELYDARKSTVVAAHESDLARLALSGDGSLLATASDKGTLIRVFDAHSGAQLREFRRGVDRALVYSIVFCPETKYLACSSDKGTVHVFNLKSEGGRVVAPNASSNRLAPYVEDHASQNNQKSHLAFAYLRINQIVETRLHHGSIMASTPSTRRLLDGVEVHPTHWLIYAQVPTEGRARRLGRCLPRVRVVLRASARRARADDLRLREDAEHGRERRRGRRVPRVALRRRRRVRTRGPAWN